MFGIALEILQFIIFYSLEFLSKNGLAKFQTQAVIDWPNSRLMPEGTWKNPLIESKT